MAQTRRHKAVIGFSRFKPLRSSKTNDVSVSLLTRSDVHYIRIHAVPHDTQKYPTFNSVQIDAEARVESIRRIEQSKVLIYSISLYVGV